MVAVVWPVFSPLRAGNQTLPIVSCAMTEARVVGHPSIIRS